LKELKTDFAYKTLDGDKMVEMSSGELNNLLSKKHDSKAANAGGINAWNSLSKQEQESARYSK
jgi:hypothetical protein